MTPGGNKKSDKKIYLFFGIGVIIFLSILLLHATTLQIQHPSWDFMEAFGGAFEHMFAEPFDIIIKGNSAFASCLLFAIIGGAGFVFFLYNDSVRHAHYQSGAESGTAKWNDDLKEYNKKYTEPYGQPTNEGINNMILTKDVSLGMNSRKTLRNNNVLVVGGSGSGKSRFLVKPNILQANCNYVITDPAGELLSTTGQFLVDQGYEVKVFNLVEMAKSDQYNPFHYIRDDLGVLMMINCLIKNTNPEGKSGGDPFWEKSETALLQALCFYLNKYCPEHQRNFTSVMKLLRAAEIDENDATRKSKLDRIFDEVAVKDPNSIALKQYLTFKMGAGKTLKSILISCSVRLTVFNMKQIENLTRIDTIDLGSMGKGKKALFVIIPAADSTYNFLVSMMYSQLFETLYFIAETQCPGQRLERPVRFLLDEFSNIGQIPEFTKKLATMRKYEISCTIILQNLAQIKTLYKDDWESIVGNCDSFLFLGGQEYSTLEYVSKELGKTTITVKSRNMSNGKNKSSSAGFNQTARDLMTPDEIMRMPKDECICFINGLNPFYGKKYDYTIHPNYKKTGDGDPSKLYKNTRDNSITYTRERVAERVEQRRVIENSKRDIYNRAKRGLNEPPIPASRAFSGISFAPIRSPEDVGEVRRKQLDVPDRSVATPQNKPITPIQATNNAKPKVEKTESKPKTEELKIEIVDELKVKENEALKERKTKVSEIKENKKTEIKESKGAEAKENKDVEVKESGNVEVKPEKVAEKTNASDSNSDSGDNQEVWDFTTFT